MAKKKEPTVEEKLRALYDLQLIDSRIDKIRDIRGVLPLEVRDLEDEIEGLNKRIEKFIYFNNCIISIYYFRTLCFVQSCQRITQ